MRNLSGTEQIAQMNVHFRVKFADPQPAHRGALDPIQAESIRQDLAARFPEATVTFDYDYKLAE